MQYRFLRFPEGRTKAVTFSYDDGCRQDLRTVKVLDDYEMDILHLHWSGI